MRPTEGKDLIEIGGREFYAAPASTMEIDVYVGSRIRRAGFDSFEIQAGEIKEEFVSRILLEILETPEIWEIVGALLLPAGVTPKDWTPALASETGGFFRTLEDEEEKAKAREEILSILLGFFRGRLASLWISRESSGIESEPTASETAPAR